MSVHYLRNAPTARETASAALISCVMGASVALVTFYLTRILIARDRVGAAHPEELEEPARSPE
jgi:hypothetical protein